ncbi:hypothetical protein [Shouchella patagoniensis]|uniref:hypothetical protein n=1 Tax=Shouchella patagoniensis TaxID=228576 RepID=UPI001473BA87|nr:hypothetical protein [Shouchella patagoniensis]
MNNMVLSLFFLSLPATSTYAVIDELRRSEAIIIGGGVTDRYIDEIVEKLH